MQTITIQVNNNSALKTLESLLDKHFISIIDETSFTSYALPGKPLSETEFKQWINDAENIPTISLTEAKERWAIRKKKLQGLMK